jgi:hypothetical protein
MTTSKRSKARNLQTIPSTTDAADTAAPTKFVGWKPLGYDVMTNAGKHTRLAAMVIENMPPETVSRDELPKDITDGLRAGMAQAWAADPENQVLTVRVTLHPGEEKSKRYKCREMDSIDTVPTADERDFVLTYTQAVAIDKKDVPKTCPFETAAYQWFRKKANTAVSDTLNHLMGKVFPKTGGGRGAGKPLDKWLDDKMNEIYKRAGVAYADGNIDGHRLEEIKKGIAAFDAKVPRNTASALDG